MNVGIADLAMHVKDDEDDDLTEVRALYGRLAELVNSSTAPHSPWFEPESLIDEGWDGHLDQVGGSSFKTLQGLAAAQLGSESHLASVGACGFFVPVDFRTPIACAGMLPGKSVGSSQRLATELDALRDLVGVDSSPVRLTTASDDIVTTWNVLWFVAADSVRYRSAIRLG